MSMIIPIEVNPTGAVAAARQVGDALGKVEDAGKRAGDTIDAGLQKSISRSETAKQAMEQLRRELQAIDQYGGSGNRANALEREQALYEKIKGPLRDYANDLRALDSLLEKQMITTGEYADSVAKLNAALGKRPGETPAAFTPTAMPTSGAGGDQFGGMLSGLTSQLGPAGSALDSLISKQNIAIGTFVAMGAEIVHVTDQYTELTNRLLRYTDAQHSADDMLQDQLSLAGDLHAGIGQTVDLYAKLREGSDELGLSYSEQIDMTRTLGEAVELSGKSLDSAGSLAQRMAFWMDTGTVSQRELKSAMREFPAVADLWTESLGKSKQELLDMAKSGQLSADQLALALATSGNTIDRQFGQHVETAAESWQHFRDTFTASAGKLASETGVIQSVTATVTKLADELQRAALFAGSIPDELDKLTGSNGGF